MTERYERQERLFGKEGQRKLGGVNVVIAGAGGLGSALAQQLAYLGVREFTLLDPDHLSHTNLNRLVGAYPSDLASSPKKVELLKRLILQIAPDAHVDAVPKSVVSPEGFAAVRGADYVFGCVDLDGPRLVLAQLCAAYAKPFFDLASEIDPNSTPMTYGGRVFFSNGAWCLRCAGEVDQEEVRRFLMSESEFEQHKRLYGLDVDHPEDSGPSVVTINSVIASLAATEFLVEVTRLRCAAPKLTYRGHEGKVTRADVSSHGNCPVCATWGQGEAAGVERYLNTRVASQ
jgi:hypothetical protein